MTSDELKKLEANVRELSIAVWSLTVDNPETATIESEAETTDKIYAQRSRLQSCSEMLGNVADELEQKFLGEINDR